MFVGLEMQANNLGKRLHPFFLSLDRLLCTSRALKLAFYISVDYLRLYIYIGIFNKVSSRILYYWVDGLVTTSINNRKSILPCKHIFMFQAFLHLFGKPQ